MLFLKIFKKNFIHPNGKTKRARGWKKVETFCKSALTKNHLPCIHMWDLYGLYTCCRWYKRCCRWYRRNFSNSHGRQNQMTFDTSLNKILCVLQTGFNLCIHAQPQPRSAIMICFPPWGGWQWWLILILKITRVHSIKKV